jgi:uncharacterized protein
MSTPQPGWPREESPFHPGEQALQLRVGTRDRTEKFGRRGIRDFMPDQHRELFMQLPFVLVGSLDTHDRPWASILVGYPGFMISSDPRSLRVDAAAAQEDPLRANLVKGAPVGLLGIQLQTRRRNRMNGIITALDERGFTVRVGQSFGNCPQYIQARDPHFVAEPAGFCAPHAWQAEGPVLSASAAEIVRRSDTFFIATASPNARNGDTTDGVDVSHRGGKPGFVRVSEEAGQTVLTVPDFRGNNHFNTFGNITVNPRAGVLFIDFDSGSLLSLTGGAEVIFDGPEIQSFAAAQRLLRIRVQTGVWIKQAVPLRWSAPEQARQLEETGSWPATTRPTPV